MFMGEYNHTIDAKGRLIVPAKFREILGDNFIVTKGLDGCLFVYPNDEWTRFEEKLKSLPLTNKNARQFTRFFCHFIHVTIICIHRFIPAFSAPYFDSACNSDKHNVLLETGKLP